MVSAHPSDDVLMEYASGALGDGMSLLVASHLTFCPQCRRVIEADEAIGGALLSADTPEADAPAFDAVLSRLDMAEAEPDPAPVSDPKSPLPRPLSSAIGASFTDIRWRLRWPGLSEHVISETRVGDGKAVRVSLLKAKPGLKIPEHTHEGDEATLILCGAMEDGGVVYRTGDVAQSDAQHDHQPKILNEGVCICLIVLTGGLRFTGTFGPALNLFG